MVFKLYVIYGGNGEWYEVVVVVVYMFVDMLVVIWDMWVRNLEIVCMNGVILYFQMFVEMFVDENLVV